MIRSMTAACEAREAAEPKPSKPKPLAVISSGRPIAEVMARLAEIHIDHHDAEVRRGDASRWEIWPAKPARATRCRPATGSP
jgi:hypothetical protein